MASLNLKLGLVVIGAAIAFGTLYYTQNLVSRLRKKKKLLSYMQADLKTLQYRSPTSDFTFIFQNIIQRIDFPHTNDNKDQITSTEHYP